MNIPMNSSTLPPGSVLRLLAAILPAVSLFFAGTAYAGNPNGAEATREIDCGVYFGEFNNNDSGIDSAVAAHRAGLILEFHNAHQPLSSAIWYRIGTLDGPGKNVSSDILISPGELWRHSGFLALNW